MVGQPLSRFCERREGLVFAVFGADFVRRDGAKVVGRVRNQRADGLRDSFLGVTRRPARPDRFVADGNCGPMWAFAFSVGAGVVFEVVGGGGAVRSDLRVQIRERRGDSVAETPEMPGAAGAVNASAPVSALPSCGSSLCATSR